MSKIDPSPALPQETADDFFEHESGPFFRKVDWLAFWFTTLVTMVSYYLTLAPTVTLEDSGELAVASDYLGVPHPPGYPIWTLVTWFFQWIFHWKTYYGQPNPAWSVGLSSAVFGALACGITALLISRSGTDMMRGSALAKRIGASTETYFSWIAGVTGGLLLAFTPVLWSQSVIVEVYSLNAFFMAIILLLFYRWMCRPKEDATLYITVFILGLGLTNHQTLVFIGPAFLVAILCRDLKLLRDCIVAGCFLLALYCFGVFHYAAAVFIGLISEATIPSFNTTFFSTQGLSAEPISARSTKYLGGFFLMIIPPIAAYLIPAIWGSAQRIMTEWKRVGIMILLVVLGLSFYAYMPFASDQNPPMNWGYPRTPEGFLQAVKRGQYERIDPIENFKKIVIADNALFREQVKKIVYDWEGHNSVVAQFKWGIALLALIPFLFIRIMNRGALGWFATTFVAFFFLTVVFIVFQNPKLDVQTLFIGRVQYIQAHAIFAIWIGYGLIITLSYITSLTGGNSVIKMARLAVLALPLVLVHRNWNDEEFITIAGGTEQNGHDFGWQFGNWQLRGANAINEELGPHEPPLPNPNYPPVMGTNAVFYGGTDPGRFVPTYMIFSAKVREDVYLITQNALADNTYMSVMRDLYGDQIWIPSQQDSNFAFQKYVQDVQSGKITAGAEVSFKDGRVSVQGVQGVMLINGILAKMIFEANKAKHPFYVEESYVIPWMYPYMEPHGLIMKINSEQLPSLSEEVVKNDREFWAWYCKRLLGSKAFHRDVVARKTFSKLRSALAGLYAYRRMWDDAINAFQEAIYLYPLSPEANFRLADVLMQLRRFEEAQTVITEFLKLDPDNTRVKDFLNQIVNTGGSDKRRLELEETLSKGGDINSALELANIYRAMNYRQQFEALTGHILNNQSVPPQIYLQVAELYKQYNRPDLYEQALLKYVAREPANPKVWIDLAATQVNLKKQNEALASLKQAITIGGEPVRDIARKDQRFNEFRATPGFQQLVPPIQAGNGSPMNFPVNFPGL